MAEKRMFAKSIVLSDAFLDMPASARSLYFTLGMCADDDGFVSAPKSVMRQCGASRDDLAILITKRFILTFDSGVIVIKHWRINNTLKNDRHRPTEHQEELAMLTVKPNKAYTERAHQPPEMPGFPSPEPERNQSGTDMEPERNQSGTTDKDRLVEGRLEEDSNNTHAHAHEEPIFHRELKSVIEAYESKIIGAPAPTMVVYALNGYLEKLDAEIIHHAIELAESKDKRTWAFIRSVLNQYVMGGAQTLERALEIDRSINSKGGKSDAGSDTGHPRTEWNIHSDLGDD